MDDTRRPARGERGNYALPPVRRPLQAVSKEGFIRPLAALISLAVIAAAAAVIVFILRPSNDTSKGISPKIISQAKFDVYFPSPMPSGYTYMKDTATFLTGQVFYRFANGDKRITVEEAPIPNPKPSLASLTGAGYQGFQSPVGPAAVGVSFRVPTGVVLTNTTMISMHGTVGTSAQDLITAINNLKNIGQKQ